jgi:hypothetical protein
MVGIFEARVFIGQICWRVGSLALSVYGIWRESGEGCNDDYATYV